jgi:phenylacetic acid degradation operon negative regulatory protein
VAVFRAEVPAALGLSDRDLAGVLSGELEALEPAWRTFLRRFGPLAEAAGDGGADVDGENAFLARTLLVHAYRRVVLREPELPAELWPPGWIGETAYELAARCYHSLVEPAEMHLAAVSETAAGPLPALDAAYADRFPA